MSSTFAANLNKMKGISIVLFALLSMGAFAQLNETDSQGRRQGEWRKMYEGTDQVRFEGQFVDDIPVGVFTYYHYNGRRKAIIEYRGQTGVAYAEMFETTGRIMAEGVFRDEKRDSTWRYYGPGGDLVTTIQWVEGEKHGFETTYYPNGNRAEVIPWMHGVKEGKVEKFFADGSIESTITYENDEVHGQAIFYDLNNKPRMLGTYDRGLRVGNWYFFIDGEQRVRKVYEDGRLIETVCLVDECPELEEEDDFELPEGVVDEREQ